jgi:nitrile hydratase subunit beta
MRQAGFGRVHAEANAVLKAWELRAHAPYSLGVRLGLVTVCVQKGAGSAFPLSRSRAEGRHNTVPRESFEIGARVRVKNELVSGHVPVSGYICGKTGIVVGIWPLYPFPDAAADNLQAQGAPTYDVQFRTEDLWPRASDPALVRVGVFESYIESVR